MFGVVTTVAGSAKAGIEAMVNALLGLLTTLLQPAHQTAQLVAAHGRLFPASTKIKTIDDIIRTDRVFSVRQGKAIILLTPLSTQKKPTPAVLDCSQSDAPCQESLKTPPLGPAAPALSMVNALLGLVTTLLQPAHQPAHQTAVYSPCACTHSRPDNKTLANEIGLLL